MLTRLELIGRRKYRLRGPHHVATDLMERFQFVLIFFIHTNISIIRIIKTESNNDLKKKHHKEI